MELELREKREKLLKKPKSIGDLSAVVTGTLLAYCLPVTIPLWILIIGDFFAIVVVKELFGGLGKNFMNPALAARCFLLISFSRIMTQYPVMGGGFIQKGFDAVTTANAKSLFGL